MGQLSGCPIVGVMNTINKSDISHVFTKFQLKMELLELEQLHGGGRHRIAILKKGSNAHKLLRKMWLANRESGETAVTYPGDIAVLQMGKHLVEIHSESGSGKWVQVLSFTKM